MKTKNKLISGLIFMFVMLLGFAGIFATFAANVDHANAASVYDMYAGDSVVGKSGNENKMNAAYDFANDQLTWNCNTTGSLIYHKTDGSTTTYSGFSRFSCSVYVGGSKDTGGKVGDFDVGSGSNGKTPIDTKYSTTSAINPYIKLREWFAYKSSDVGTKTGDVWIQVVACDDTKKLNNNDVCFWINAGDISQYYGSVYVSASGSDTSGNGSKANPYATISKAYSGVGNNGTIYLLSDITVTSNIAINGGKTVTVTSDTDAEKPYTIKGNMSSQTVRTGLFNVTGANSNITLTNVTIDGTDMPHSGEWSGAAYVYAAQNSGGYATLTLGDGATVQNFTWSGTTGGMAVLFASDAGVINITDGAKITGNTVSGGLSDNPASIAIGGSKGTINMTGGEITGNTAPAVVGLGMTDNPKFNMTGGTIKGNTIMDGNKDGYAAVYMRGAESQCTIQFSGNAYVYDNKDTNGNQKNVYLKNGTNGETNAYVKISGTLSDGAMLGVIAEYVGEGTVIAKGEGYTATASDAAKFFSDNIVTYRVVYDSTNNTVTLSNKMLDVVYVSADGNDETGDGTREHPFATVAKAYLNVKAGGKIILLTDLTQESSAVSINIDKAVTITSDEETTTRSITRGGDAAEELFNVSAGTLTLNNVTLNGGETSSSKGCAIKITGGTVNLDSSVTIENFSAAAISGSGKVTLSEGVIITVPDDYNGDVTVEKTDNGGKVIVSEQGGKFTVNNDKTYTAGSAGATFVIYASGNVKIENDTVTLSDGKSITGGSGKEISNPATSEGDTITVTIDGSKDTVTIPANGKVTIDKTDYVAGSNGATLSVDDGGKVAVTTGSVILEKDKSINVVNKKIINIGDESITVNANADKDGNPDGTGSVKISVNGSTEIGNAKITASGDKGVEVEIGTDGDLKVDAPVEINGVKYTEGTGLIIDATGTVTGDVTIDGDELKDEKFSYELLPGQSVTIGNYTYTAPATCSNGDVTIVSRGEGKNPAVVLKNKNGAVDVALSSDKTTKTTYTAANANTEFAMSASDTDTKNIDLLDNGQTANSEVKVSSGVKVTGASNAITSAADDTVIGLDSDKNAELVSGKGTTTGAMSADVNGSDKSFDGNGTAYTVDTDGKLTLNENGSVKMDDKVTFSGKTGDEFTLGKSGEGTSAADTVVIPMGASISIVGNSYTAKDNSATVSVDNGGNLTLTSGKLEVKKSSAEGAGDASVTVDGKTFTGENFTVETSTESGKITTKLTLDERETAKIGDVIYTGAGTFTFADDGVTVSKDAVITGKDGEKVIGVENGNTKVAVDDKGNVTLIGGKGVSDEKIVAKLGDDTYEFAKTSGDGSYTVDATGKTLTIEDGVKVSDGKGVKYTGEGTFTFADDGVTESKDAVITSKDGKVSIYGVEKNSSDSASKDTIVEVGTDGTLTLVEGKGKVTGAATVSVKVAKGETTETVSVTIPEGKTYTIDADNGVVAGLKTDETVTVGQVTYTSGSNNANGEFSLTENKLVNNGDKATITENNSITVGDNTYTAGRDGAIISVDNNGKAVLDGGSVIVSANKDIKVGETTYTVGDQGATITSDGKITQGSVKLDNDESAKVGNTTVTNKSDEGKVVEVSVTDGNGGVVTIDNGETVNIGGRTYVSDKDGTKLVIDENGNVQIDAGSIALADGESVTGGSGKKIENPTNSDNDAIKVTTDSNKDTVTIPANGKVTIDGTDYVAGSNGATLGVGEDDNVALTSGSVILDDGESINVGDEKITNNSEGKLEVDKNGTTTVISGTVTLSDGESVTGGSGKVITNPTGSNNDKVTVTKGDGKDIVTIPAGGKVVIDSKQIAGDKNTETTVEVNKDGKITVIIPKSGSVTVDGKTYTDTRDQNAEGDKIKVVIGSDGNINVVKPTPKTPVAPTISIELTYGQKLSDITLSGDWEWDNGTIVPSVSDSGKTSYNVKIKVDDVNYDWTGISGYADGYYTATVTVKTNKARVNIVPAAPTISTELTYGQKLSDITLPGSWTWVDGTIVPSVSDSKKTPYSVKVKVDDVNYDWTGISGYANGYYTTTVTVKTNKATATEAIVPAAPTISTELTYGQKLSDITLSGGWAWVDGTIKPSVSDSGKTSYNVKIKVDDDNYDWTGIEGYANGYYTTTVKVTVNKATYNMSNVTFNGDTVTYDGKKHSLAIGGRLPSGVTVTYTNNGKTESGVYTVIAKFVGDSKNYNAIPDKTATLTIKAKDITGATVTLGDSLTYNGSKQTQTVASVTIDGLAVTYTVSGNKAVNAGKHTLTITANGNFAGTVTAAWSIATAKVTAPAATSGLVYTGLEQTGVADGNLYTVTNGKATNAGSYTATVTLKDTANYEWATSFNDEIAWSIAKATYNMSGVTFNGDTVTYDGKKHSLEISGTLPNGVTVTYEINDKDGIVVDSAVNVGEYTVTAKFSGGSDNYEVIANKTATLTIKAKDITGATVKLGDSLTYNGSEQTQTVASVTVDGLAVTYTVSGNTATNAGKHTLTITANGNFAGTVTADWSIATAKVTVPTATGGLIYTGSEQTGVADGNLYTVTDGKKTNAGNYTANVTLKDTANYEWSDTFDGEIKWSIAKAKATTVPTAPTISIELTYGQKLSDITLSGDWEWDNGTIVPSVSDSGKTSYSVKIEVDDDNYDWTEISGYENGYYTTTVTVKTNKAKVTVPTATSRLVYTGSELTGVADGDLYTVTDGKKTNAGNYTANVTLKDTVNYEWSDTFDGEIEWSIAKATYNMNGVTFVGETVVYDGKAHSLALNGTLPDGVTVTYENNGKTESGNYTVTAKFSGDSDNYNLIPDKTAMLTITPKDITGATVTLGDSLTYNGSKQTQTVRSVTIDDLTVTYTVRGNVGTNAESYTLTITADGNFTGTVTADWSIAKAKVTVPTATSGLVYNGTEQTGVADNSLYTVTDGKATKADKYTAKVTLNDTENYEWGTEFNGKIAWSIAKAESVINISKVVTSYTYNGKSQTVNSGAVLNNNEQTLVYSNNTFTTVAEGNNKVITVSAAESDNYKSASETVKITVAKATYDMSGITFEEISVVSDGAAKSIVIFGKLPDGVNVTYEGNGKTESGVYTVTAKFSGDSDNYDAIADMIATLTIKQATIENVVDGGDASKPNVIVSEEDGIDPNVQLVVVKQEEVSTAIKEEVARDEIVAVVYDITLKSEGVSVQPNGDLTIRLLISDVVNGRTFRILHLHDGKVLPPVEYTIDGDYAVFTVDKLSEFSIVVDNSGSALWLIILLAVIVAAEIVLIVLKKRKTKGNKLYAAGLFGGVIPVAQVVWLVVLGVAAVALGAYAILLYLPKKKTDEK